MTPSRRPATSIHPGSASPSSGEHRGAAPATSAPVASTLAVLVPAVLAALASACSDRSQPAAYEAPRGAERVLVGLGLEVTDAGRRLLRIEADSGFTSEGTGTVTLVGVEARGFDEAGTVRMTLQADSGTLDEETRRFTVLGNVRVGRPDGSLSVEAEELAYDPDARRLRSDSALVTDGQGRTRSGPCFEGDPLLVRWQPCGGAP